MRVTKLKIENFRSFKDQTINFDNYTCMVGSNGAGKSAILTALNVFFRNTASSATNVVTLSEEDFHHRNTNLPVKITLTFERLSDEAKEDFKHYCRQDKLTVFAKAVWDKKTESAEVKQYGARLVMQKLSPYFEAQDRKMKVGELKEVYAGIRKELPDLPAANTKQAMVDALRNYEEEHPEQCELCDAPEEFYGWSKGKNRLNKYIQWVYIPAVKDASSEQEEGSKTALGVLLSRTIRTKVDFDEPIGKLKSQLEEEYRKIIDKEQEVLSSIQESVQNRLREWANPSVNLALNWHYDPNKSLIVNEPVARVAIGEDDFLGEVVRLGHGVQRAFIIAILQELAGSDQEGGPTLFLGFEEPELYQHPPQAQHIAALLENLSDGNVQIVVSTHSPYFVSSKGFENIRVIRKRRDEKCSVVRATTFADLENRLVGALGESPRSLTSLMARTEQIMQPSQKELFFTRVVILVEGIEDIAYIVTSLQLSEKWSRFRELGCHFIVGGGKSALSRPLAIAQGLGIAVFVVFDSDANVMNPETQKVHAKDNSCILRLCGNENCDALPTENLWCDNVVMWKSKIGDVIREDIGGEAWDEAEARAKDKNGFIDVKRKNTLLIAATLEELALQGKTSPMLDKLCCHILSFAENTRA